MNPREFFAEGGPGEQLGISLWPESRARLVEALESGRQQHVLHGGLGTGKTFVMLCGLAYDIWEHFAQDEGRVLGDWVCVLTSEQGDRILDYAERILKQVFGEQVTRVGGKGESRLKVALLGERGVREVTVFLPRTPQSLTGENVLSACNDAKSWSFWGQVHNRWLSRGPRGRWWVTIDTSMTTVAELKRHHVGMVNKEYINA